MEIQLSALEILFLVLVAFIGHAMALFWMSIETYEVDLSRDKIYNLPIKDPQVRRELKNSLHTPLHAVILLTFVIFGFFENQTIASFWGTLIFAAVWAEIWHYTSHRAFHLKSLHWIHAEHHKSRLSSPFTALSFSFSEKLIFDMGIIGIAALIDSFISLNFYGLAIWFIGYLIINSYGHANYEIRGETFAQLRGKFLTSTVYHALHHSRYTGNYGLGTRFMDQWFGTEWKDSDAAFEQIVVNKQPFETLREEAEEKQAK